MTMPGFTAQAALRPWARQERLRGPAGGSRYDKYYVDG
jgi:hypothetical protein